MKHDMKKMKKGDEMKETEWSEDENKKEDESEQQADEMEN